MTLVLFLMLDFRIFNYRFGIWVSVAHSLFAVTCPTDNQACIFLPTTQGADGARSHIWEVQALYSSCLYL